MGLFFAHVRKSLDMVCKRAYAARRMRLTKRQDAALYIAVAASVHAAIVNKGRSKPEFAAGIAREHALAAVAKTKNGTRHTK